MVVSNFIPEIGSAAHIYFDLARAFINRGHNVDVITSYPQEFNLSKDDVGNDFLLNETIEGIGFGKCRVPVGKYEVFFKRENERVSKGE